MLTYMLDTNICMYVMKNYPLDLREKLNALAEQLCMSRPKPRCRSWGSGNSRPRPAGQHAERGAAFPQQRTLEGDLAGTCNFSRGASRGDGLRDALDPRQR